MTPDERYIDRLEEKVRVLQARIIQHVAAYDALARSLAESDRELRIVRGELATSEAALSASEAKRQAAEDREHRLEEEITNVSREVVRSDSARERMRAALEGIATCADTLANTPTTNGQCGQVLRWVRDKARKALAAAPGKEGRDA